MNQQIYEEASEWLVELRAARPDREARRRFEEWLSTSPEHVRAYLEQTAIWESLGAQQPAESEEIERLIARAQQSSLENVVPLITAAPSGAGADAVRTGIGARPRRRALLALAASLLLAIIGAGFYFHTPRNVYATSVGEQRSILLPDGSTIDLNARSRVRVRFDEHGRRVDLIEGQALFRVAKDKARPFIVAVNGSRVRAVGTQFDINQRKRGVVVTVVEGTVAVSGPVIPAQRQDSSGSPAARASSGRAIEDTNASGAAAALAHADRASPRTSPGARASEETSGAATGSSPHSAIAAETGEILLDAGQQLTLASAQAASGSIDTPPAPHRVDVESAMAWTHRRLVFEATPLEDVAAEFNRNSERAIIIRGHGLDDFHVSGAFSSTDVQPFLRFLRAQGGIEVIEEPDRIIVTHR